MPARSFLKNAPTLFMGEAPAWYKAGLLLCLLLNPIILFTMGPVAAGWAILLEFLVVLALALKCYPLFPGGLLAIEALVLRMAPLDGVMKEIHGNIDVIMLLMFLVPAIFFMKPLMVWIFMRLFAATKDKVVLSLVFLFMGAFLSAWLDALTVVAVMISVCWAAKELSVQAGDRVQEDLDEFNGFLRNLLMHGAVGTALGGVATLIGEPQNILIGHYAGLGFNDFYMLMAHISIPLQLTGLAICWALERFRMKMFGFGYQLPARIAAVLDEKLARQDVTPEGNARLLIMALLFIGFMFSLAFQIAPIGIIGLGLLILVPVLTGQTDEHTLGNSFRDSLPFTALLVVFFVIVAMIEATGIFTPISHFSLQLQGKGQLYAFFTASGILSSVSDNVFVASVFIHQAFNAFSQGVIDKAQFDHMAIVINAGTNIFSILTPNGQAAFLFLLTSSLGRAIHLSYVRMFMMTLPYAVVLIALSYMLI